MKPSRYSLLFFALLSMYAVSAQQKKETLGNDQVVSLTKAGIGSGIILTKINSSVCHFDMSTNGLIALKKAGVDPVVLQAMMDRAEGKPATSMPEQAVTAHTATAPARSQLPKLDLINLIHFYDKATQTARPLERASASLKSKTKFLGYGGASMVLEISQPHSPVRIRLDSVRSFIVNAGTGVDGFVLYRAEIKSNNRQGITAKYGMSGLKGSQGVVGVDMRQIETGIYEVIPNGTLAKGEYFFAAKTGLSSSTMNVDVYAFGID